MTMAAVRTAGLTKRFGSLVALQPLDLEVAAGEILGYLGPNGAGKTVTIRLLLGLLRPSGGRAEIFGVDALADPVGAHRRLAYVPGETALWPGLTGEETLHLLGRVQGSVDEAYRRALVERFDLDPARKVRAYSKGNRQKIGLIAAFASRADLLLLDEPTTGLDPLMEQQFRACVLEAKARGQTVFLSSHILSEVEAVCERVVILRSGRVVEQGTLAELRHLAALTIEATFDGPPPDLAGLDGVEVAAVDGNHLHCHVTGSVDEVLRRIAGARVTHLVSREPSLEELFLAHYGAET
jgi:ABC-2 type transport system ATP-binding protein